MLEIRKPVLADDPDRLLQYEHGVFEVVSPAGQRLRITCPLEHPLNSRPRPAAHLGPARAWWRIEKTNEA